MEQPDDSEFRKALYGGGRSDVDSLQAGKRWGWVLRAVGVIAFVIGLIPHASPMVVAGLIGLPIVGAALVWSGRARLGERVGDARPSAMPILPYPAVVLAFRAIEDCAWIGWLWPLALSLGAAGLLIGLGVMLDRRIGRNQVPVGGLVLFSLTYGFGTILEANELLDRSRPDIFETRVMRKHMTAGKITHYQIVLAPWGPEQVGTTKEVDRGFFDQLKERDVVCVVFHSGALRINWYSLGFCPAR